MKREEILKTFESLARSQGLYGRILRQLNDEILEHLEKQNFKDAVDLVMYIEG